MAFALLGRSSGDELLVVSAQTFVDRQEALRALGALAHNASDIPADTDVILVDLETASPVVFVRPMSPDASGSTGSTTCDVETKNNSARGSAPSPADARADEIVAAEESAGADDEVEEEAAASSDVETTLEQVEADLSQLVPDAPRAERVARDGEPVPVAGLITEAPSAADLEAIRSQLAVEDDASSEAADPLAGEPTAQPGAPPELEEAEAHAQAKTHATTAITPWPWQHDSSPTPTSTPAATAEPENSASQTPAPEKDAAPAAATTGPDAPKEPDTQPTATGPRRSRDVSATRKSRTRRKKSPSPVAATTTLERPPEVPVDVDEVAAKLGALTDELPADLAPMQAAAKTCQPSPAPSQENAADLTCAECVYVETCPHTADRTPAECDSFQWRAC